MLRIGICDDESGSRDAIRHSLQKTLRWDDSELQIYEFSSGEGLLSWLDKHPDELELLFLDYEMRGITGLEAARTIRERNKVMEIVFVTGYADYVYDGYSVRAAGYLVKPLNHQKFREVLLRVLHGFNAPEAERYIVHNNDGIYRIPTDKILYFHSDRRVVHLVTGEREYTFYKKLDDVARELPDQFIRIHQRYLVRSGAVDTMRGNAVTIGATTLPVSRACREQTMAALAKAALRRNT